MARGSMWEDVAGDYEQRLRRVVGETSLQTVADELAALGPFGRAADLGCGSGIFTRVLAPHAENVVALDSSPAMVAAARRALEGLQNVEFRDASCLDTGLADSSQDTVLMANLLQIVPRRADAAREAARILRPDGRMIVLAWTPEGMGLAAKVAMMWRYLRAVGLPPRGARGLKLRDIEALARDAGLDVERACLLRGQVNCALVVARRR